MGSNRTSVRARRWLYLSLMLGLLLAPANLARAWGLADPAVAPNAPAGRQGAPKAPVTVPDAAPTPPPTSPEGPGVPLMPVEAHSLMVSHAYTETVLPTWYGAELMAHTGRPFAPNCANLPPLPADAPAINLGAADEDYFSTATGLCDPFITLHHAWNPNDNTTWSSLGGDPALEWANFYLDEALDRYGQGDTRGAYYFLGRAAHLVGDLATPAHVHGDAHVHLGGIGDPDSYEEWLTYDADLSAGPLPGGPLLYVEFRDLARLQAEANPGPEANLLLHLQANAGAFGSGDPAELWAAGPLIQDKWPAHGWVTTDPGRVNADVFHLIYWVAERSDDYDSDDADGEGVEVDRGDGLSAAECGTIRDGVWPRGVAGIAALIQLFYELAGEDDLQGPAIGAPVYSATVESDESLPVEVQIEDAASGGNGVAEAALCYGYAPPYAESCLPGAGPGGNGDGIWAFAIPAQGVDRVGQELRFTIRASDGDETPSLAMANNGDVGFPVTVTWPDTQARVLTDGWNLLTCGVQPLPDAATALDEIEAQGGDAGEVYRWLSAIDAWEGHVRDLPFNNFPLELGQGYFFKAGLPSTWQRSGVLPAEPVPVQLKPVWTLIGLPRLPCPMTAEDLLQDATAQGGDCTEVYRWDAALGAWEGHVRGLPFGEFDITEQDGYFLKCEAAILYVPGGGGLCPP